MINLIAMIVTGLIIYALKLFMSYILEGISYTCLLITITTTLAVIIRTILNNSIDELIGIEKLPSEGASYNSSLPTRFFMNKGDNGEGSSSSAAGAASGSSQQQNEDSAEENGGGDSFYEPPVHVMTDQELKTELSSFEYALNDVLTRANLPEEAKEINIKYLTEQIDRIEQELVNRNPHTDAAEKDKGKGKEKA